MAQNDYFLQQTAKDYDLPYHIVEAIYKKADCAPVKFYELLEEELTARVYRQRAGA